MVETSPTCLVPQVQQSTLLQFGFSCSKADSSLFIYRKLGGIIYLLLYIDDIVTSNNTKLLTSLVNQLNHALSMKDLSPLHYFLGIEVQSSSSSLFLSQTKYACDLLNRATMLECNPVLTPMVVG